MPSRKLFVQLLEQVLVPGLHAHELVTTVGIDAQGLPLRCYGAVTVPSRLSMITGEMRKSIVGGPPNLASTMARQSPP